MFKFIYKTTHVNGKFYIGKHTTSNLNDGYLGSGKWVNDIVDKTTLTREFIEFTQLSDESLAWLEIHHINEHYDHPLNMNFKRGSDGNTSEDARELCLKLVASGDHHFIGPEINQKRIEAGVHNLQSREDGTSSSGDRVKNGTHNFLGDRNPSKIFVTAGTHHFLGPEINQKMMEDGTHPTQQNWKCPHCGTFGKGASNFARWHGDNCKKKSVE